MRHSLRLKELRLRNRSWLSVRVEAFLHVGGIRRPKRFLWSYASGVGRAELEVAYEERYGVGLSPGSVVYYALTSDESVAFFREPGPVLAADDRATVLLVMGE